MKLLIDLQAAQGVNGDRGIGRYSLALTDSLLERLPDEWSIDLLVSSRFPASALALERRFANLVSGIHVIDAPVDSRAQAGRSSRTRAAQAIWCAAVERSGADLVLVTSFIEGFHDDVVVADPAAVSAPVVGVIYDLIPLLFPDQYLTDQRFEAWYRDRLGLLGRCEHLLAISRRTAQDAESLLGVHGRVSTIYGAAAPAAVDLGSGNGSDDAAPPVSTPYIVYVGGIDWRKNVEGLINGFGTLRPTVRAHGRLVLVCAVGDADRARLTQLAQDAGLRDGEFVLTGHVSDNELAAIYRGATACVFPSLYEGLGLPALEAIELGCPVVASDAGSLPEIVADAEARFDPIDPTSMAVVLERVMTDEVWRQQLAGVQLRHARDFTWSRVADAAWDAMASVVASCEVDRTQRSAGSGRARIAVVSPFPPTPSGISDYSEPLVHVLDEFYDVERVDPSSAASPNVRDAAWFRAHAPEFDMVVYHFGNSEFHWEMFDLARSCPGIVVFHDVYLSSLISFSDRMGWSPGSWPKALYNEHGLTALAELLGAEDDSAPVWKYPASLEPALLADAVIVHSEFSRSLGREWYGVDEDRWDVIPLIRDVEPVEGAERLEARRMLGVADDDFLVVSLGGVGPAKLSHRVLDAYLAGGFETEETCRLVFVGGNVGGAYGDELERRIMQLTSDRIELAGRVDDSIYRAYLAAADVAVQLRTRTRGETSAAILDAMSAGVAVIANRHGSTSELPDGALIGIDDDFTDAQLVDAIRRLRQSPALRSRIAEDAQRYLRTRHASGLVADGYREVIERTRSRSWNRRGLQRRVGRLGSDSTFADRRAIAEALAATFPPPDGPRQLLIDISELVNVDAGTGIQRVVRELLDRLLRLQVPGWHVEPVHASVDERYRYARSYVSSLLDPPVDLGEDLPVEMGAGDVFLGLDLAPHVLPERVDELLRFKALGAAVHVVVYDLLPIRLPECFLPGARANHERWLTAAAMVGDLVAISSSVADDARRWLASADIDPVPAVSHFTLGSDFRDQGAGGPIPEDLRGLLARMRDRPTFAIVGTIEPRKAHEQVLAGFELLWASGVDVGLAIVGRQGWMVEDLAKRLMTHPELGRRLSWTSGAGDVALDLIVEHAAGVVMASLGEGFGLPVVEARGKQKRVLARDLPVFREVADEDTIFFSGSEPSAVADVVLEALHRGTAAASRTAPPTWNDSARGLLAAVGLHSLARAMDGDPGATTPRGR